MRKNHEETVIMKSLSVFAVSSIIFGLVVFSSPAQKTTNSDYIKYLPLSYPKIISQTQASRDLELYGNTNNLLYCDSNKDGIDDNRYNRLKELCHRFSPILFKNTPYSIPLDFKGFFNKDATPPSLLYIDTWDLAHDKPQILKRETINFALFDRSHRTFSEDCQLFDLIREFDPETKITAQMNPNQEIFKVLYFDFPGEDEKSWKEEYKILISGNLRKNYEKFSAIYAHPFIHGESTNDGNVGYEFVIQYWFFYPFNDGTNNHEGDWEHLNVIVTVYDPEKLDQLLSAQEVQKILKANGEMVDDDQLVIKRVEYYLHRKVMILNYVNPNVYLPPDSWEAKVNRGRQERVGEKWIWEQTRKKALDETGKINTHPIGYIGGDNKGLDQILTMPGGKNRDSHGTYPFPGTYKGIGSLGATEDISSKLNYHKAMKDTSKFVSYSPEQIVIVPDWERVKDLVLSIQPRISLRLARPFS